jgi:pentapeptide MXKDX repeat protein
MFKVGSSLLTVGQTKEFIVRKIWRSVAVAVVALGVGTVIVGCDTSTSNGKDKMGGDKTNAGKMGDDKMGGDKMGGNKMDGDKMGGNKMDGDKMGGDKK